MKRILLAAACCAALCVPAWADMPVIDTSNLAQMMNQVRQGAQQLQQLQQQLTMLQTTYQAFSHITDLGSAVSALGMIGVQNPLPINAYAVQGLMTGRGNFASTLGSLGGLFNQSWSSNHVYAPTDNSWQSQEMIANGNSIASAQAMSQGLYQAVSQRIPLMQQLLDRLNTATDPKDVLDLQARIQAEQAFVQSQEVQAQTLTTWYAAQVQAEQQRQHEQRAQDIQAVLAADPDWRGQ